MRFDTWMRAALYEPRFGYYARGAKITGKTGDFYTSPGVGRLFGRLLAARFADWLGRLHVDHPDAPLWLVEAGANDGTLAKDVADALAEMRPAWLSQLRLCLVEPSQVNRELQHRTLDSYAERTCWIADPAELGRALGVGVFYANELLDAFPVRRFGWDAAARRWFEWHVGFVDGHFHWELIANEVAAAQVSRWLERCGLDMGAGWATVLPDRFAVEICEAAASWWERAANLFDCGVWLAIDYGRLGEAVLDPSRSNGTLRAYRNHRHATDILADPGEQDLTTTVDWEEIRRVGEQSGLQTLSLDSQERFLISAAELAGWMGKGSPLLEAHARRQFQELTHPGRMGRSFQALTQSRRFDARRA